MLHRFKNGYLSNIDRIYSALFIRLWEQIRSNFSKAIYYRFWQQALDNKYPVIENFSFIPSFQLGCLSQFIAHGFWFHAFCVINDLRSIKPDYLISLKAKYQLCLLTGGWGWFNDGMILSRRTTRISLNPVHLPHNPAGPAIEWNDGFSLYFTV